MDSFRCPFCESMVAISADTHWYKDLYASKETDLYSYRVHTYKCPKCDQVSMLAEGTGSAVKDEVALIRPKSLAHKYPDYVPSAIREDYEEAQAIVNLSPKASATLSRRCLQGMIRDFWGISKNRLIDEIDALRELVAPSQWKAIDGLRRIGNIGAHMEKDVNLIVDIEPEEAKKLIRLIELLIDKWYISRHDEDELYESIAFISKDKQASKNP